MGNYSRMRCELEASLQQCCARGWPWPGSPCPAPWRQAPATLHMLKAQKQGAPPCQSSGSLVGLVWWNPSAEAAGTLLVLDSLSCAPLVNFLIRPAILTWQSLSTSGRGWRTWGCPQGWVGSPQTRKGSRGSTTHRWLWKLIKTQIQILYNITCELLLVRCHGEVLVRELGGIGLNIDFLKRCMYHMYAGWLLLKAQIYLAYIRHDNGFKGLCFDFQDDFAIL